MVPLNASPLPEYLKPFGDSIADMQRLGQLFCQRGWNRATSGSYSVVVHREPTELLITTRGSTKGCLKYDDFVLVNSDGRPVHPEQPPHSSRAVWHCEVAKFDFVGAIIHTHSVWTSLLALRFLPLGGVLLEDPEMLQGLAGISNPAQPEWLPILSESKTTTPLTAQVQSALAANPPIHAFIIQNHGLFTWGQDLEEAAQHTEVLQFLCEVIIRQSQLS